MRCRPRAALRSPAPEPAGHQRLFRRCPGLPATAHLTTRHDRLFHLEKKVRDQRIELSAEQIRLLERFSPEFRERHIETRYTGDLVAIDTFMVGSLQGVGRVYMQTVIDCYSRYAWGRLYTSKMPVTAVHTLNSDVIPSITWFLSISYSPDGFAIALKMLDKLNIEPYFNL